MFHRRGRVDRPRLPERPQPKSILPSACCVPLRARGPRRPRPHLPQGPVFRDESDIPAHDVLLILFGRCSDFGERGNSGSRRDRGQAEDADEAPGEVDQEARAECLPVLFRAPSELPGLGHPPARSRRHREAVRHRL